MPGAPARPAVPAARPAPEPPASTAAAEAVAALLAPHAAPPVALAYSAETVLAAAAVVAAVGAGWIPAVRPAPGAVVVRAPASWSRVAAEVRPPAVAAWPPVVRAAAVPVAAVPVAAEWLRALMAAWPPVGLAGSPGARVAAQAAALAGLPARIVPRVPAVARKPSQRVFDPASAGAKAASRPAPIPRPPRHAAEWTPHRKRRGGCANWKAARVVPLRARPAHAAQYRNRHRATVRTTPFWNVITYHHRRLSPAAAPFGKRAALRTLSPLDQIRHHPSHDRSNHRRRSAKPAERHRRGNGRSDAAHRLFANPQFVARLFHRADRPALPADRAGGSYPGPCRRHVMGGESVDRAVSRTRRRTMCIC